jgi:hypothetical protein
LDDVVVGVTDFAVELTGVSEFGVVTEVREEEVVEGVRERGAEVAGPALFWILAEVGEGDDSL